MTANSLLRVWDPEVGARAVGMPMQVASGVVIGASSSVISAAGVNPAATGADNVLAVFTVPAGAFAAPGDAMVIAAYGSVANNANTKRIKIIFNPTAAVVGQTVSGGTTLADTGAFATAIATAWDLEAEVYKVGAFGSNTQVGINISNSIGATSPALLPPVTNIAAVESGPILIAVTGNATTTATDITFNVLEIEPHS
jgi:hypothetical protein